MLRDQVRLRTNRMNPRRNRAVGEGQKVKDFAEEGVASTWGAGADAAVRGEWKGNLAAPVSPRGDTASSACCPIATHVAPLWSGLFADTALGGTNSLVSLTILTPLRRPAAGHHRDTPMWSL